MVSFTLDDRQKALVAEVRGIAKDALSGAHAVYSRHLDQADRFKATRPFYEKAIKAGLLQLLIPKAVGGRSESFLDTAIILEELHGVDSSIVVHAVGTALGLLPLVIAGTPEQQKKYFQPFISGEGTPLASLAHSEPQGTANFLEKGGKGFGVTAQKDGDFYIINGEKLWTTNIAGWDEKGADLTNLCVRYAEDTGPEKPENDPADNVMIVAITRDVVAQNDPEAFKVLSEPNLMGHTGASGPHTRYTNFRVPVDACLFPPGKATAVIEQSFGVTAALVGAMALGTMRVAFETALDFARRDNRGGSVPIIQRQSPADLLINAKIKIDTSRMIVWKAVDALENGPGNAQERFETCLEAKIYPSDASVACVWECMQAVGMSSYGNGSIFPRLLNDAAVFSLFDGGNIGIRRRQFQRLLASPDYQPWANFN
ncbi:hypothetical protein LTR84_006823 [Exophiala bonariae]|uniref:Acyl-CoA dehydrogenase n=1 Tax=Exophiala bonariae TaxID=1690606 RepID=A0AAV9N089_9EURO|nr:hypothetical protein LTR84_006823 [Exophiala bonariae]